MNIPPILKKPCREDSPVNLHLFGPFCYSVRFPVVRKPMGFPLIGNLRKFGNPSAIRGLIVSIGINPVERKSFGHLSHVGKKVLENIPSLTHPNPASGVVFDPVGISGEVASPSHPKPTSICRSLSTPMCLVHLPYGLTTKATTASSMIFSKIAYSYDRLISTVAPTENLTPWKPFKGGKPTDLLSKFYHRVSIPQGMVYVNRGWHI